MFLNKAHQEAYQYLQNADFEKAVKKYTDCIKNHPDSADLFSERGVAFLNLQQKENCLADLNFSANLQPMYAYRYASRAHAKDFFGDLDGAIEDYEKATELDPSDSIVYNNLGLLLEKKGNISKAKSNYMHSDKLRLEAEILKKSTLENLTVTEEGILEEKRTLTETNSTNKNELVDSKKNSTGDEIMKFFKEKNQWSEFLKFLKNGLKIK